MGYRNAVHNSRKATKKSKQYEKKHPTNKRVKEIKDNRKEHDYDIPVCELLQLIYVVRCPSCKKLNYFDDSGFEDETAPDPNGLECFACGTESVFETELGFKKLLGLPADMMTFAGKPSIKDVQIIDGST